MKFTYQWEFKDLKKVKSSGLKSLVLFSGGGGSSLGHMMSGNKILGAVEIDSKMVEFYSKNLKPKYKVYCEDIRDFNKRNDLPKSFYNLDILEGSPPCSSFSCSGNRHNDWKKNKKFAEGQKEQILDELFFNYLDTVNKLRPKVFVAENVKGIILGMAKRYANEIIKKAKEIGYDVQVFLLNSQYMGVPQSRERVFFIGNRLGHKKLKLNFNESLITVSDVIESSTTLTHSNVIGRKLNPITRMYTVWYLAKVGSTFNTVTPEKWFNHAKISPNAPMRTITSQPNYYHWSVPAEFSDNLYKVCSSFPEDYIGNCYVYGMSIPPLMTYKILEQIKKQWFN